MLCIHYTGDAKSYVLFCSCCSVHSCPVCTFHSCSVHVVPFTLVLSVLSIPVLFMLFRSLLSCLYFPFLFCSYCSVHSCPVCTFHSCSVHVVPYTLVLSVLSMPVLFSQYLCRAKVTSSKTKIVMLQALLQLVTSGCDAIGMWPVPRCHTVGLPMMQTLCSSSIEVCTQLFVIC